MRDQQTTHESFKRRDKIKGSSDRGFGLVFTVVFALIGGIKVYGASYLWGGLWLGLAAATLTVALTAPRLLFPFNFVWMRFGILLGRVVNPVIMGLTFFLAVAPMGLLRRAFGWDGLRRRFEPKSESYWIEREPSGPLPESMKNQF